MRKNRLYFILLILFLMPAYIFPAINISGGLTHEFTTVPGENYEGTIIISNNGDEPEEVKLYFTDYRTEAGGKVFYLDPGTTEKSNYSWIKISPMRFFVPAGKDYIVYFTVNVPQDSTLAGTFWSMLMVEAIPKDSPESSFYNPEEVSVGISTVLRYGIRMISHIHDTGTIKPEVTRAALENEEGKVMLTLDIKNAGSKLFRLDFWVELYDTGGNYIGKFTNDRKAVFPGSSMSFSADLSTVPEGDYMALVVLDCGNDNVFGVNYDLEL